METGNRPKPRKRDRMGDYPERRGPRFEPYTPVPGRTFHDIRIGDRVVVEQSGRTGVVVSKQRYHVGRKVRWDEPVFGVVECWVSEEELRPVED